MIDGIAQDLRYGVRSAGRNPVLTIVIVVTLALAMGTGAVLFTVVNAVVQAVPVRHRDRVVSVAATDPQRSRRRMPTSAPDFADWHARSQSFELLGAVTFGTLNLTGVDTPLRLRSARASADMLSILLAQPQMGRTFTHDEDRAGRNRVVLLTDRFWRSQFKADPSLITRSLTLDGEAYAVIGVLPLSLDVGVFRQVDVWVPLSIDGVQAPRDRRSIYVLGELKRGVARAQSGAEMARIARQLQDEYPTTNTGVGIVVDPAIDAFGTGGNVRFVLGLLLLMAGLLVAVACANVANVLLARALGRRRELAIRAAIGASRAALIRQLLLEDLLLSLAGAAGGLLLCAWEIDAVKAIAGSEMPIFSAMTVDAPVLGFTTAAAVVASLAFGLLPAWRSSRPDLRDGLKEGPMSGASGMHGQRLRGALVGCQVAIALMLLIEVGVLARAAMALHDMDKGFEASHVLTLRIDLPQSTYGDLGRARTFFESLTSRLDQLPGVRAAGTISQLPIADRERLASFTIDGRPAKPGGEPWAALATISAGYRNAMAIPLIEGRDFTAADSLMPTAVALISRLMAQRYWPNQRAIAQRIHLQVGDETRPVDVIGVVGDVRNSDPDAGLIPQIYTLESQFPHRTNAVVVRAAGDPAALTSTIRAEVAQMDKDQPIYDVKTMERVLFEDLADMYILVGMLVGVATIALGMAAAGTYAVAAYSVTQRTHEIGIRMALGAGVGTVQRMILRQGLVPAIGGGVGGLVLGVVLVRASARTLNEIAGPNRGTYLMMSLLIGAVSLLGSYLPARRATAIDPIKALRTE
jgi:putative ABC transport system permease protein